jgi:hypothetical protein
MQVDEAWREATSVGFDHALCVGPAARLWLDRRDAVALDQDIRAISGRTGAIDDRRIADQQVVIHRPRLSARCKDEPGEGSERSSGESCSRVHAG